MNDFTADDIASTQPTARDRLRPPARQSGVLAGTACYVEDRLLKAHAIAAVITRVFDGVDSDDRNETALMGALTRAHHLVCECRADLDSASELQFSGPCCTTDPVSDLEQADALPDVATGISIIGFITPFSREVASSYLSSIQDATLRTLEGLRAAIKIQEVCHA